MSRCPGGDAEAQNCFWSISHVHTQERTKRLPVAQAKQVLKYLPQSSVIAYEVGNEPDHFYKKSDPKSFGRYLTLWKPVANALVPIVGNKLAGSESAPSSLHVAPFTSSSAYIGTCRARCVSMVPGGWATFQLQ